MAEELRGLYEEQTESNGNCFFDAVAKALRQNPRHFACFLLGLKYQCTVSTISSRHIRAVVADSVMDLPDDAQTWETWRACAAVPEMRHEFAFAMPLLYIAQAENPASSDGKAHTHMTVPTATREEVRHNMMSRRYWADHYAILTVAENLQVNICVIEAEHDRTAVFKYTPRPLPSNPHATNSLVGSASEIANTIIVVVRREHYTLLVRTRPQEYMFFDSEAPDICIAYLDEIQKGPSQSRSFSRHHHHCHCCNKCGNAV